MTKNLKNDQKFSTKKVSFANSECRRMQAIFSSPEGHLLNLRVSEMQIYADWLARGHVSQIM